MRFLVTAGNTREMIDRVRAWSNIFTGNTGLAIARELATIGEVDLFTSNAEHLQQGREGSINIRSFVSHADLKNLLAEAMSGENYDGVFMTAAVADYEPVGGFAVEERQKNPDGTETWRVRHQDAGKISSAHKLLAVLGKPTEKLVDLFRTDWQYRRLLVKFKLEVEISEEQLKTIAQKSRRASGGDFIVANTLDMVEGERAGAWVLGDGLAEWVERSRLAARLREIAMQWLHTQ